MVMLPERRGSRSGSVRAGPGSTTSPKGGSVSSWIWIEICNRRPDDRLGRLDQAGGVVTLDPFAEKGVRHPDFQRIAIAAEPQPHTIAEPETKPRLAQTLGHRRAQRGLHDRRTLGHGLRPSPILPLPRVSRHGAIPRKRRAHHPRGAHTVPLSRAEADQSDGMRSFDHDRFIRMRRNDRGAETVGAIHQPKGYALREGGCQKRRGGNYRRP